MAPNYTIRATVFDIRDDKPQENESFAVDTNIWLWLTYTKASAASNPSRLVADYSAYFQKCLAKHCQLFFLGLTFSELAHQIEMAEREIYKQTNKVELTSKEFRHNFPTERVNVTAEVQAAWAQVKALGEMLGTPVDEQAANDVETYYKNHPLDGYDLFILEAMTRSIVSQILTDDGDFATIPDLRVFTSNLNVIATAHKQGKLKRR